MQKIIVIGAGAWGTAMAIRLAERYQVVLWARSGQQFDRMALDRVNTQYLPGTPFPERLLLGQPDQLAKALQGAVLVINATPTDGLATSLQALQGRTTAPLLLLSKGFVRADDATTSPVAPPPSLPQAFARAHYAGSVASLTGPSFAHEFAQKLPTAVLIASEDIALATTLCRDLRDETFRLYPSNDSVGAEIGGAVKNVLAIAAGISDGLGFGGNARAALITRGLAEITRLAVAMGGRAETIAGLAGLGDLVLTCTGDLSRNRRVGLALAQGISLAQISGALGHVAEGVHAAPRVVALAAVHGVEMPISDAVHCVLSGQFTPGAAVANLLAREPNVE